MLSTVLSNFLTSMANDPSKTIRPAALDARMKLEHEARTQACLTCEKAGWLATLQQSREGPFEEFVFTLGKCVGGVILQSGEGFGLQVPPAPFFCSSAWDHDHSEGRLGGGTAFGGAGKTEGQSPNDGWPRQREKGG